MFTQVGARNSHLVKLYAVSFIQLIMVLGVVVLFTEVKEVFIMSVLFWSENRTNFEKEKKSTKGIKINYDQFTWRFEISLLAIVGWAEWLCVSEFCQFERPFILLGRGIWLLFQSQCWSSWSAGSPWPPASLPLGSLFHQQSHPRLSHILSPGSMWSTISQFCWCSPPAKDFCLALCLPMPTL